MTLLPTVLCKKSSTAVCANDDTDNQLIDNDLTFKVIGDLKNNSSSLMAGINDLVESWKIAAEQENCLNSIEHAIQCGNGVIDVIDGYFISKTFA